MRAVKIAVLQLALIFLVILPAHALNVEVANFKLANGMEVVVIPNNRAPVVTHMVWYRVGSADEVSGKSGLAHFLEHLMFKGTSKRAPGEFDRLIDINGGEGNAFTARDYTAYFQRIASDRLELMMELEADRMQNLVLTDENVLPELDVVREERRERTDNNPSALLGEQVDAAMYTAHPYGKPIIGWMSEVAKLTREDAMAFYRAHYTPANAVLVVAGDVTPEQVKVLAEKYYGVLKNSFTPEPRLRTAEPDPIASRRVTLVDARAASPVVQRSYLTPSYATANGREALALDLLADILGSGTQSRFYKNLVIDQKIAAHAAAWFSGDQLDSGTFGLYGAPNPGADVAKVEAAIDAILADVLQNGVTQKELDRVRNQAIAERVYALDNQAALARMAGVALTTGLSARSIFDRDIDIEKVTLDDIKQAAEKFIVLRRSVTGILLPETQALN
ncbi:MAG: pitrilysin family protein [Aestuariivirga sp.]|nr:pitrilysin family protein [Aestuariivirga sp.]